MSTDKSKIDFESLISFIDDKNIENEKELKKEIELSEKDKKIIKLQEKFKNVIKYEQIKDSYKKDLGILFHNVFDIKNRENLSNKESYFVNKIIKWLLNEVTIAFLLNLGLLFILFLNVFKNSMTNYLYVAISSSVMLAFFLGFLLLTKNVIKNIYSIDAFKYNKKNEYLGYKFSLIEIIFDVLKFKDESKNLILKRIILEEFISINKSLLSNKKDMYESEEDFVSKNFNDMFIDINHLIIDLDNYKTYNDIERVNKYYNKNFESIIVLLKKIIKRVNEID